MAGRDTNIGAKRARELRADLALDEGAPMACVLSLVESDLAIPVVIARLPDGIAGCCWRDGTHVVLWVNGTQAPVRQRFTLAHELGHVRCRHDASVPVDTFETLAGRTTDSREIQANAFAAELLAPAAGVCAMVAGEPTLDDVVAIAARHGISTIAALYRLNTLGLTNRYERLAREIDGGLQDVVWERLDPAPIDDLIDRLERDALPRLSPSLSGSALASLLEHEASVDAVARVARCDAARLSAAASAVSG